MCKCGQLNPNVHEKHLLPMEKGARSHLDEQNRACGSAANAGGPSGPHETPFGPDRALSGPKGLRQSGKRGFVQPWGKHQNLIFLSGWGRAPIFRW